MREPGGCRRVLRGLGFWALVVLFFFEPKERRELVVPVIRQALSAASTTVDFAGRLSRSMDEPPAPDVQEAWSVEDSTAE